MKQRLNPTNGRSPSRDLFQAVLHEVRVWAHATRWTWHMAESPSGSRPGKRPLCRSFHGRGVPRFQEPILLQVPGLESSSSRQEISQSQRSLGSVKRQALGSDGVLVARPRSQDDMSSQAICHPAWSVQDPRSPRREQLKSSWRQKTCLTKGRELCKRCTIVACPLNGSAA